MGQIARFISFIVLICLLGVPTAIARSTPIQQAIVIIVEDNHLFRRADPDGEIFDAIDTIVSIVPGNVGVGVILAGTSSQLIQDISSNETRSRGLASKLREARTSDITTNYGRAFGAASRMLNTVSARDKSILLISSSEPMGNWKTGALELSKNEIPLFVLGRKTANQPFSWEKIANDLGGFAEQCDYSKNAVFQVLEMTMFAAQLQLPRIDGRTLTVDSVTDKLHLVVASEDAGRLNIIPPRGKKSAITKKKSKRISNVHFRKVGVLTTIAISKPEAGRWNVNGISESEVFGVVDSRLELTVILPRRRFAQTEHMNVAAFMSREGNIIKINSDEKEVYITASLVDQDQGIVESTTLSDRGILPDAINADGIFTGRVPLESHNGAQFLRVIAETPNFVRQRMLNLSVIAEDWLTFLQPSKKLDIGSKTPVLIELNSAIDLPENIQLFASLTGHEQKALDVLPNQPDRFSVTFPEIESQEPGKLTLAIKRLENDNDLFKIVESREQIISYVIPAGHNIVWFITIFVAFAIFVNGGIVYYFWRKRRQVEEEEAEAIITGDPADITPIKEEKQEQVIVESDEDDLPIIDHAIIQNVGDRIGAVAAVHKGESVKGEIESPSDSSNLDRDADSESVSSLAFERQTQWLDQRPHDSEVDRDSVTETSDVSEIVEDDLEETLPEDVVVDQPFDQPVVENLQAEDVEHDLMEKQESKREFGGFDDAFASQFGDSGETQASEESEKEEEIEVSAESRDTEGIPESPETEEPAVQEDLAEAEGTDSVADAIAELTRMVESRAPKSAPAKPEPEKEKRPQKDKADRAIFDQLAERALKLESALIAAGLMGNDLPADDQKPGPGSKAGSSAQKTDKELDFGADWESQVKDVNVTENKGLSNTDAFEEVALKEDS